MVVSAIIGQNTLGLVLALLMRAAAGVRAVVGAVVVGAWVMPEVVAGFCCTRSSAATARSTPCWRAASPDPELAVHAPILAVSLANIWRGTAFSMLVYSAALSEVPKEIEEAAEVDGAAACAASGT